MPEHLRDPERTRQCVEATAQQYLAAMQRASKVCERAGARMMVLLQPCLFTKKPRTEHDATQVKSVLEGCQLVGLDMAYEKGYAALREALKSLSESGVESHDLTGILDGVDAPIYLDYCHVTDVANERIAERVGALILRVASSGSRPPGK